MEIHDGKRRENAMRFNQIVAKAWSDTAFKQRLIADPVSIAEEYGIEIPAGIQLKVVEDTDTVYHVVLPRIPSSEELTGEQLQQVAGGQVASYNTDSLWAKMAQGASVGTPTSGTSTGTSVATGMIKGGS